MDYHVKKFDLKYLNIIFSLNEQTIQFLISGNLYFEQKRAPKLSPFD